MMIKIIIILLQPKLLDCLANWRIRILFEDNRRGIIKGDYIKIELFKSHDYENSSYNLSK